MEIEKLRIQADKEVWQEFAPALANFLSKGNMTLSGTPETAQKVMDNMAKGFGVRAMSEGFLGGASSTNGSNGHSVERTNQVDALLSQLGRLVVPAVEKLTGQKVDGKDQTDALANAIASNPAALQAIVDALKADAKAVPVTPVVADRARLPRSACPNLRLERGRRRNS